MCGRYTLSQSGETIAQTFDLPTIPRIEPRYNIAPTQPISVVRSSDQTNDREFTFLLWGLIPSWAKDIQIGSRLINARAETLAEKPSFRTAFQRRRCLVIADGFYEWQKPEASKQQDKIQNKSKSKQPYYFHLANHQPFAFAGLWEHWENGNGDVIESCTIVTTSANEVLQPIHDRMPVILHPQDYDLWLDKSVAKDDRLQALLRPYDASEMESYPVSATVNSPKNDSADCVQPLSA